MTAIDPRILDQLSAWMDGELPANEARFLQRRLRSDAALREQWERWQLASACLRRHPVRLMDPDLGARVAAATAGADNAVTARRPRWAWLASAAAVVLAVSLLPGILAVDPGRPVSPSALSPLATGPVEPPVSPAPRAAVEAMPPMSPLPSVRDFPLVDNGGRGWPRSPLLAESVARNSVLIRNDGPSLRVPAQVPAPRETPNSDEDNPP